MTYSQAVKVINYSLDNGYTGLFKPKDRKNGKVNRRREQSKRDRDYLANYYGCKEIIDSKLK